jgi:hypothetical protein
MEAYSVLITKGIIFGDKMVTIQECDARSPEMLAHLPG